MNILVTGANGQLGTELRNVTAGSRDNYIFSDVVSADGVHTFILDITDLRAVRKACATLEVDVIINCAAYTNVDMAEEDPQSAMTLNASAPANLAVAAAETGAFLIQISTTSSGAIRPFPTGKILRLDRLGSMGRPNWRVRGLFGVRAATGSSSVPHGSIPLTERISSRRCSGSLPRRIPSGWSRTRSGRLPMRGIWLP